LRTRRKPARGGPNPNGNQPRVHRTQAWPEDPREAVSRNALKHGTYSKRVVLPWEDPAEVQAFAEGLRRHFQPRNPVESFHLEEMISYGWRMLQQREARSAAMQTTYQESYDADDGTPAERRLRAIVAAADNGTVEAIGRQATSDARAFQRALENFQRARAESLIGFPIVPGLRLSLQVPINPIAAPQPVEPPAERALRPSKGPSDDPALRSAEGPSDGRALRLSKGPSDQSGPPAPGTELDE